MSGTPWVIDQNALITAQQARLLAYMACNGSQGVLGNAHLTVSPTTTPSATVNIAPGAFAIKNTGVGGDFEAYVGKFSVADTVTLTPTGAAARTDLIIGRVENPYAAGTGSWAFPADQAAGPYWFIRGIEGVTPTNIPDVVTWNPTWSAIPLARITRPANTGIVQASHITDLRALVTLATERITVIQQPTPDPTPQVPNPTTPTPTTPDVPVVSHDIWTGVVHCSAASTLSHTQSAWIDWPAVATFQVPVPSWAVTCDFLGSFNPQYDDDTYGEVRLKFNDGATLPITFDENEDSGYQRANIPVVGVYDLPANVRGKVITVKLQAHMLDPSNEPGNLKTRAGVYLALQINFKRAPN